MFDPSRLDEQKEAGDHPASDVAERLPLTCNVPDDVLHENISRAVAAGMPLIQALEPHDRVAVIVGGGPSAEHHVEEIRAAQNAGCDIFALNGSGVWLQRHGIAPHALIVLDARQHNAKFLDGLHAGAVCYIATQCHPDVFAAAQGRAIVAWHPPMGGKYPGVVEHRPTVLIGGGTSVGIRALRLTHVIGYRALHLFGYDSSYADGASHVYDQFENANDRPIGVQVGGRWFVSTPWMIRQGDDFQRIAASLLVEGMTIHVHGDGLLPEIARQMGGVD